MFGSSAKMARRARGQYLSLFPHDLFTWLAWGSSQHYRLRVEFLHGDCFPQSEGSRNPGRKCKTFYDLASEVMQHHFCFILLVKKASHTQESTDRAPNGLSRNNLSIKINKIVLYYKPKYKRDLLSPY